METMTFPQAASLGLISAREIRRAVETLKRLCNPKLLKKKRSFLVHLFNDNVAWWVGRGNYYIWNEEAVRALYFLSTFSDLVGGGADFFGVLDAEGKLIKLGENAREVNEHIFKVYRLLKAFKGLVRMLP